MEEKKKNNIGLKVTIIILVLMLLGSIGYICYDKFLKSDSSSDSVKEETNKIVEVTVEDEARMLEISKLIFNNNGNQTFNDLDNQVKLNIAIHLSQTSVDEVKGETLISVIKNHFGEEAILKLEDLICPAHYGVEGDNIYYTYNSETDSYIYNNNHPGHGGSTDPNVPVTNIYKNKIAIEGDKYLYTVGVYYTENRCHSDICISAVTSENIYKTYDDAVNKRNQIIDAVGSGNYCDISNEFSTEDATAYSCDYEKIYNGLKDKLNTYTFVFEKVGENLVFKNYSIDK